MSLRSAEDQHLLSAFKDRQSSNFLEPYMIILRRVAQGIHQHWQIRATEWVMVYPAFLLSCSLVYQQNMFEVFPAFAVLAGWATQPQWAIWLLLSAAIRLGALVINGTFKGFRYSPHLRVVASYAGAGFWGMFCLGFLIAAYHDLAPWSAPVAYSTLVLMEFLNIYRSWTDVYRKP